MVRWDKVGGYGGEWGIGMFIGSYEHRLDEKGRLVLPAPFREPMEAGMVASAGIGHCVSIYSRERWSSILTKVQNLPFPKGKTRDFLRVLLATAQELELDRSGRILIGAPLRQHGGILQDVVVLGAGDHLEVWDAASWKEYSQKVLDDFAEIAEEVEGL